MSQHMVWSRQWDCPLHDLHTPLEKQQALVPQIPLTAMQKNCSEASQSKGWVLLGEGVAWVVGGTALQHQLDITICSSQA